MLSPKKKSGYSELLEKKGPDFPDFLFFPGLSTKLSNNFIVTLMINVCMNDKDLSIHDWYNISVYL